MVQASHVLTGCLIVEIPKAATNHMVFFGCKPQRGPHPLVWQRIRLHMASLVKREPHEWGRCPSRCSLQPASVFDVQGASGGVSVRGVSMAPRFVACVAARATASPSGLVFHPLHKLFGLMQAGVVDSVHYSQTHLFPTHGSFSKSGTGRHGA